VEGPHCPVEVPIIGFMNGFPRHKQDTLIHNYFGNLLESCDDAIPYLSAIDTENRQQLGFHSPLIETLLKYNGPNGDIHMVKSSLENAINRVIGKFEKKSKIKT